VRQAEKDMNSALRSVNLLAPLLLTLNDPGNPLMKLAVRLRDNPEQKDALLPLIADLLEGKNAAEPVTAYTDPVYKPEPFLAMPPVPLAAEADKPFIDRDPEGDDSRTKFAEHLQKTPEGIPAPKTGKDPGEIYVHTKALIVDEIFAMLGSANHNERSMWHDTEDMLAVRGFEQHHFPGALRKKLMETVLSGAAPEENSSGEQIFEHFSTHLKENAARYQYMKNNPKKEFIKDELQLSFVFPYIPKAAVGSGVFS
jgi:phosphatidylserine/phosphatidylglycerophosphate/cardiolipin synthase-like enzyme